MRASLFCAITLIAAVCVACSAPYLSQPTPKSRWASVHFTSPCSFSDVPLSMINNVNYDPTSLVPPASTPITATSSPISTSSTEYTDLQSAFSRAPDFFKNQVCGLSGVYILPSGALYSKSWGFRDPKNLQNRYIGISRDLWGDPKSPNAMYLTDYEKTIVNGLVYGLSNPMNFDAMKTSPNDGAEMLLAVLAHEFGHVLWTDLFISQPGQDPVFSSFCPGIFPTSSWYNTAARPIKWTSWRKFGDVADTATDISDPNDPTGTDEPTYDEIKVAKLTKYIQDGRPKYLKKGRKIIDRLLASQARPWPSLFGAFSATEDFVETFRLYVLTHPQANPRLTNLPMIVPLPNGSSDTIDIPNTINSRPLLSAKLQCIDRYIILNPP